MIFFLTHHIFFNFIFAAPFITQILNYCASRLLIILIIGYLFYRLLFATQMLGFDYMLISHSPCILKMFYLMIFEL